MNIFWLMEAQQAKRENFFWHPLKLQHLQTDFLGCSQIPQTFSIDIQEINNELKNTMPQVVMKSKYWISICDLRRMRSKVTMEKYAIVKFCSRKCVQYTMPKTTSLIDLFHCWCASIVNRRYAFLLYNIWKIDQLIHA